MKIAFFIIIAFTVSIFSQTKNTITLNAIKDTSVKADEMVLEISVYKTDTASVQTNGISHKSLVEVLNVLKKYGYKDENIFLKESNFQSNLYQKQSNYSSLQTYRIIFNNFELYDQLKKELIDAGATGVRIAAFWSTRYEEIKRDLYIRAIAETKKRAQFLSKQMGLKNAHISEVVDNSREESNSLDLSFINNLHDNSMGYTVTKNLTIATQQSTITNGQIDINVFLKISFMFE